MAACLSGHLRTESEKLDWHPLVKWRVKGNRCQSRQVFSLNDDALTAIEIFVYFEIDFRSEESAQFGSCVLNTYMCWHQSVRSLTLAAVHINVDRHPAVRNANSLERQIDCRQCLHELGQ